MILTVFEMILGRAGIGALGSGSVNSTHWRKQCQNIIYGSSGDLVVIVGW